MRYNLIISYFNNKELLNNNPHNSKPIIIKEEIYTMIEQIHEMSTGDEKAIERVIQDENIHYLHMVLNKEEGLPEHFSNSNVYMTVVRGTLSIGLNDQEVHQYDKGTLLKIPVNTKMNVKNLSKSVLELIVVKAPAPLK